MTAVHISTLKFSRSRSVGDCAHIQASVCVRCVSVVSVCGAAWHVENPRVQVPHVSVCTFKTLQCVPASHTRKRFERTHGDVWNPHTGPLSPLVLSSFSLPSFSSFVLFLFSSLFSSLSVTMTMIARPVGSLFIRTTLYRSLTSNVTAAAMRTRIPSAQHQQSEGVDAMAIVWR